MVAVVFISAMISGFLKTQTFNNDHVHVFDISEARVNYFKSVGIIVNNSIESLVDSCDIVVLAVKVMNGNKVYSLA